MLLRASLLLLALGSFAACGKAAGGKLQVDTPVLPYIPPDIDELTGITPPEEPDEDDKGTEPAPPTPPPPKK